MASGHDSTPTPDPDPHLVTKVLGAVGGGEPRAAAELLPLVYAELRNLARSRLSRLGPGQTLQATALVHEAWLRVIGGADPGWECRAQFFAAAARAMRNILVDQARSKATLKRDVRRIELASAAEQVEAGLPAVDDLLVLDDVLARLEERDSLQAQIVMLRFFTGMTMNEVSQTLGLPLARIEREWRFARAWLAREFDSAGGSSAGTSGP